jgi:hypothetical protein
MWTIRHSLHLWTWKVLTHTHTHTHTQCCDAISLECCGFFFLFLHLTVLSLFDAPKEPHVARFVLVTYSLRVLSACVIFLLLLLFVVVVVVVEMAGREPHPLALKRAEQELKRPFTQAELDQYADLVVKDTRKRIRIRFWRLLQFFLFLIYPTVTATVLRYFMCRQLNGKWFLLADMSQTCYSPTWNLWSLVAAVFALLYPLGIPLFFFVRLYRHRYPKNRLHAPSVRAENGFLYDGYTDQAWYFEMVDMMHKLLMVSVIGFVPSEYQLMTGIVIAMTMLMILLLVRPYRRKGDDRLHLLVQIELILILYCGFAYQNVGMMATSTMSGALFDYLMSFILIGMCILLSGLFILQAVKFAYKFYQDWWRSKYPEEARARAERARAREPFFVDRRAYRDDEEVAEAKRARRRVDDDPFSMTGAHMQVNPLFGVKVKYASGYVSEVKHDEPEEGGLKRSGTLSKGALQRQATKRGSVMAGAAGAGINPGSNVGGGSKGQGAVTVAVNPMFAMLKRASVMAVASKEVSHVNNGHGFSLSRSLALAVHLCGWVSPFCPAFVQNESFFSCI